jgi:arylsulfatase A-like enzyme
VPLPPYLPDNPVIRKDMARNYTNIMLMDKEVGKILKELEEDGLLENTIIFFFSDHGSGMPRAKKTVYDSGLRPPLIIRYPKKKFAGTVDDQMISFIDFAPTVLSLAGVKIPNYLAGRAFAGSQKREGTGYIYAATDRIGESYDMIRAVRDKRFKYIRNYRPRRLTLFPTNTANSSLIPMS